MAIKFGDILYLLTYLPTNLVSQKKCEKVLTIEARITFVQSIWQIESTKLHNKK